MRNRILKIATMLAVCLPTLAMAQQPRGERGEGTWEFSLSGGVLYVDGSLRSWLGQTYLGPRFSTDAAPEPLAPTAVASVGYNFNRHLGFSLAGIMAVGSGVTYVTPEATVTYTMNLNSRTSPFVLVGMDLTRINGESNRVTHSTSGLHAGLGLRHMISDKVALRIEGQMGFSQYKEIYLDRMTENSFITVGLSYFVGGHRRPREAAPMAAAVCRPCTLARVDTIVRMRRDTVVRVRVDTLRRTDTVLVQAPEVDQMVLRVQFVTDSTRLLRRTLPLLDSIARAIIATPSSHWEVQGHTDNVGTPEHNRILAQGRAESVLEYLVSRGVDRGTLIAKGFGEDRPVVSNATVEGRAQNRRVQLRRRPEGPPPGPPVK
jgi:outer membrane protein OmpA-like peptidoglycan-associated protein/opacity protein-like surface antigen